MPVPLIAAALIAAGSASGAGGLSLGGKGASDMKKAQKAIKRAETRYLRERERTEQAESVTNANLAELGRRQEEALRAVVVRMGDFLRRHAKQVHESERLLVDGIEATTGKVVAGGRLDVDAVAWMRGAAGAVLAGGGASAGLTTAVGAYGVASTGAAISALSGAAAESATLAFLGGGSLASGGGGMALGATALNFVTVGPAILVAGLVVKGQGTKARTKAHRYEAQVNVETVKMFDMRAHFTAVDERVQELADLLDQLVARGVESLDLLESETFDPAKHAQRFQHALNLVMAVRDVAATPVVDGSGELNDNTEGFSVRYRPMAEDGDFHG